MCLAQQYSIIRTRLYTVASPPSLPNGMNGLMISAYNIMTTPTRQRLDGATHIVIVKHQEHENSREICTRPTITSERVMKKNIKSM